MSEIRKFPDGYDVRVLRKQDVLDCIEQNIVDKEVALAIVKQCEIDANTFLKEGRWVSIPFIGSIKHSKFKAALFSEENRELKEEAANQLEKDQYVLFKKNLFKEVDLDIRQRRFIDYEASKQLKYNYKYYKHLVLTKGELVAKLILYTLKNLEYVDDTFRMENYLYRYKIWQEEI